MRSHVDYAQVDAAMKKLQMDTSFREPESRMMDLIVKMEEILDRFNLSEAALDKGQERLVRSSVSLSSLLRSGLQWKRFSLY